MEGFSTNLYKGIKGYWKRKHYHRINRSASRHTKPADLGSTRTRRKRRFWRIKVTPKLKFFSLRSTKKFFLRLRDSYVDMMLGVASSRGLASGFGGGADGGYVGYGVKRDPLKEYDEKMIIEMYKKMMAQGQLVPRNAGNLSSAPGVVNVCR